MPARFRGAGATIGKLEELVNRHGAVMIEKDPKGFRVVVADQREPGGITWFSDEVVAGDLATAVQGAMHAAEEATA